MGGFCLIISSWLLILETDRKKQLSQTLRHNMGRENTCCHGESISAICWRYEKRLNIVRKNRKRNG